MESLGEWYYSELLKSNKTESTKELYAYIKPLYIIETAESNEQKIERGVCIIHY